ncbi:MAG: CARDB domain-containing protein [Armatimonadota bacterium]
MRATFLTFLWVSTWLLGAATLFAQEKPDLDTRGVDGQDFVAQNDLLDIRVGPRNSNTWIFRYAPGQSADAVYLEHYGVWTPDWGGIVPSENMTVEQGFRELQPDRLAEAVVSYSANGRSLRIIRRVQFYPGASRQFNITYVLTNTGSQPIQDVRFFQTIDFDIAGAGGDYAWYNVGSDSVFMNDDSYYRVGFTGSIRSSHHGTGHWSFMLYDDWDDGQLNDQTRYPASGTADAGVGLQWNIGDLAPGQTWEVTVTFFFGGAAGIQALIPDRTVGRGREVILDASASNSVDQIVAYEWDLDNDGQFDDATGVQVPYRWDTLGQYVISVRVRDSAGRVDEDSAIITVVPDRDLQVTSVAPTPSENFKDGQTVTANIRIRNEGVDAVAQAFRVAVFASSGGANERLAAYQDVPSLGANATVDIALPVRLRGNDSRLRVVADYYNWVSETSESNNAQLLEFAPVPAPDLVVSGVRIQPAEGLVDGQRVEAVVTVANNGADTLSDFRVILLPGATGNPMPVNGVARVTGGLAQGASTEVVIPFEARAGTNQTVGAQVDDLDEAGESDETNNGIRSSDPTVRERAEVRIPDIAPPDLIVESLSHVPSADIAYGQEVQLRAVVRNAGGATLRPIAVQFLIDEGSVALLNLNGLAAGASQPLSASWTATSGTHTLRVVADPYFRLPDANTDNNRASLDLPEIIPPDLEIANLTFSPDTFAMRQRVSVAVEVRNVGQGRINTPVNVEFRLDDATLQVAQLVPPIPPGSSQIVRIDYTARPGQHRLQAIVDPSRTLGEANVANNVREVTLPDVRAPEVALSELELLPTNPQVGQQYVATVRVRNTGGQLAGAVPIVLQQLDSNGAVLATSTSSIPNLAAGLDQRFSLSTARPMGATRLRVRVSPEDISDPQPDNNTIETDLPVVPPPDFVLSQMSVQLPGDLRFGSTIRFNVQIRNDGGNFRLPIGYPQGIPVRLFVDGQAVGQALIGGLDSGVSTEVSVAWNVDRPIDNPLVRVVVDPDNVISESNEDNNATEERLAASVAPVDFTVESIDIQPTGKPAGDTANVIVRVRSSGAYQGRLSVAAQVDGTRLPPVEANVNIPEGGTTDIPLRWTVTPGANRAIRAEVDPDNRIAESDDTNNVLNHVVNYPVDAPDFAFGDLQYEPTEGVRQGDRVRVRMQVLNNGGAYQGNVPVRISIDGSFQRNLDVLAPEPGGSRQIVVEWPAIQGNSHPLTAVIDPDNVVAESNEENNSLAQVLAINVAPRPALELTSVSEPPVPLAPGQTVDIDIVLRNNGQVELTPVLEVTGLPEGWGDLSAMSLRLVPGQEAQQRLRIRVPSNVTSRDVVFTITATASAYSLQVSAQRTLRIIAEPIITSLTPVNGATVGTTDLTIRWNTHVPASTEVLYRSTADADWRTATGEPGTQHSVTLRNLQRNARYVFIARSTNAYGSAQSEERTVTVTKGIAFTDPQMQFEARRDYDQRFSVTLRNNDSRPHQVQVSVLNSYDDAPAGFIGLGSFDEPIIIQPNGTATLTFACHFQNARNANYAWRFVARTVGEPEQMTDEAEASVRVRPSQAQLVVDLLNEDPTTRVQTYRIRNIGTEPAVDVNVAPDDSVNGQVGIEPQVSHAYLAPGEAIEFKVFPLYSGGADVGGMRFENVEQAMLEFENSIQVTYNLVPFDMYIAYNGVEIGALQNQIPLGVQVFSIPPAVFALSNTRSARVPAGTVRLLSPAEQALIRANSRAVGSLRIWEGNQPPLQITVNTDCPPDSQLYEVNLGSRVLVREIYARHCANQPSVTVPIGTPPGGRVDIRKSNFNDGHFWNISNLKLKLCMRDVIVTVCARSADEAMNIAQQRLQELYKQVPRNLRIESIDFLEARLGDFEPVQEPFRIPWRGNVRVRVSGDGDLSQALVKVDFDNGDQTVVLKPLGGTGVFLAGVTLRNTPRAIASTPEGDFVGVIRATATATGCEGSVTQSRELRVKSSPLLIRFTDPPMTETGQFVNPIRIPFKGTATVMIKGVVLDAQTQEPVTNAIVRLRGSLRKLLPTALSPTVSYNEDWRAVGRNGQFVFVLLVEEPGELQATVEAREEAVMTPPGTPVETAQKSFTALAVTTIRYHVEASGYRQIEPEGDVEVELRQGLKELRGTVLAWQLEGRELQLKPLRNATIVVENGGTLRTNAEGNYSLTIDSRGTETETHDFKLLPEDLRVQVYAIPESMLGRSDFNGAVGAALGKDLQLRVQPQTGLPQVETGTIVRGRRFRIEVSAGSTGEQLQELPLAIRYNPPQNFTEPFIRVEVTATDEEIPQLKGTRRFLVYKNAFLRYSKLGFEDVSAPLPVDGSTVSQLPGSVRGGVIERQLNKPSAPIADVQVLAVVQNNDTDPRAYTDQTGNYDLAILSPPEPAVEINDQAMQFEQRVWDLVRAMTPIPDKFRLGFEAETGFPNLPITRYLREWAQQTGQDRQKLQSLLSAAARLEAAVPALQEFYEARKQYGEELVKAVVDILLFFASELKIFETATDSFTALKGFKLNAKLAEGALDDTARLVGLDSYLLIHPEFRDDMLNILKNGMSDANLNLVKARYLQQFPGEVASANAFVAALTTQRTRIQAALEGLVSAVRGEITGLLRKLPITFGSWKTIEQGVFKTDNELVGRVIDSVFGSIDGLIQQAVQDNFTVSLTGVYDSAVSAVVWPFVEIRWQGDETLALAQLAAVDRTIQQTGSLPGDDALMRSRIQEVRATIQNDRQWRKAIAQPFGLLTGWLNDTLRSSRDVLLGNIPWWAHVLNFIGSVADGLLPVGKVAQAATTPIVWLRVDGAGKAIWEYDLMGQPEPGWLQYWIGRNLLNEITSWLTGTGGRGIYGTRSRQAAQFEAAARRLAALMTSDQVTPEQLQTAVNEFIAATAQVNERIRAREQVLNQNWLDGSAADPGFAAQAGAAVDIVDRGTARRMQLLAAVAGFIESSDSAQAANAVQTYNNALEEAIALTAASETQVDQAIQRMQTLGVQLPAVLYVTGLAAPQPDGTQQVLVLVRNEGAAVSSPVNVQVQVSGAFDLVSAGASAVPALAPSQEFTFTAVVRPAPTRGSTGMMTVNLLQNNITASTGWIPLSSVDTIAPQVLAVAPASGEVVRSAQPLILARVLDSGVVNPNSLQMLVDGSPVAATYDAASATLRYQPTSALSEGEHRVRVSASDLAGNVGSAEWAFTVNLSAPVELKDVQVAPNPFSPNGDGIDDVVNIQFRLTGEAPVQVLVLDSAGQVVRTLHALAPMAATPQQLSWDGKDDADQPLPAGTYTIRLHIPAQGTQTEQVVEKRLQLAQGALTITGVSLSREQFKIGQEAVTLRFNLSQTANVTVNVFAGTDTADAGAIVRRFTFEPRNGQFSVTWNGTGDNRLFVAKGIYTFQIVAESGLEQTKLDKAAQVNALGLPNLRPTQLLADEADGKTRLSVRVVNEGEEPANNVVVRLLYGSQNIGEASIDSLQSGQQQVVSVLWDAHRGLLTRDLTVVVDPENSVEEMNEYDNTLQQSVEVAPLRLGNTFPAGLSIISIPMLPLDANPASVLGIDPAQLRIAWWDPVAGAYRTANDITALEPGKAYWVRLPAPADRLLSGVKAPSTIRLQPGWNLFGVTQAQGAVVWDVQQIRVRKDQQILTLAEAQQAGWVEDYAWGWQQDANDPNRGSYVLIYDANLIPGIRNTLEPWKGYWIKANVECELILP